MSQEAMLPCFVCGRRLENTFDTDNQPSEGTEFRTYGHYGSTFWDSFDGEELVLNVCDECLTRHMERLAQHKRYLPVQVHRLGMVGKQWTDAPMVPFSGYPDDRSVTIEPEEIGTFENVEWCANAEDIKKYALDGDR